MSAPLVRWAKTADPADWKDINLWHAFTPEGVSRKTALCGRSFKSLSPLSSWTKVSDTLLECDKCEEAYHKTYHRLLKHRSLFESRR